jgi:hypothetical protein
VRALPIVPKVLLVNATGRDHPRRAGLALHLGAVLGLPTVGVTTRPLVAKGPWPVDQRGATLWLGGEVVGLLGPDPDRRQAGGGPRRLADRRPGRGPGRAGRDPSCPHARAPAPRLHPRPNPAGTQPLTAPALTRRWQQRTPPSPSAHPARHSPGTGRSRGRRTRLVRLDCPEPDARLLTAHVEVAHVDEVARRAQEGLASRIRDEN